MLQKGCECRECIEEKMELFEISSKMDSSHRRNGRKIQLSFILEVEERHYYPSAEFPWLENKDK